MNSPKISRVSVFSLPRIGVPVNPIIAALATPCEDFGATPLYAIDAPHPPGQVFFRIH